MATPELNALIVRNIADLDRTRKQIDQIERILMTAIGKHAENWAKKRRWQANLDYPASGWDGWDAWLAPTGWHTKGGEPNSFDAWFSLEVAPGDTHSLAGNEDAFILTRLLGKGSGSIGLLFSHGVGKRAWKKLLQEISPLLHNTSIQILDEGNLYIPLKLDENEVADALLEENPEAALEPLDHALSILEDAQPKLDKIVAKLRQL